MTPRNTKQGASANARRAPATKGSRAASSPRTTKRPRAKSSVAASPTSWRWWLLPLVVIAIAAIFVATYYPVAKVQYRETRERARLRAELKGVQARNGRLSAQVERLKTPEGVEDYARLQLGLVKAGEKVGVVVDESASLPATIAVASAAEIDSEEAVVPPVGPWTAFLDSVFGVE